MPEDVRDALVSIISQQAKMGSLEAEKYFDNLEKQSRYQEECWS